MAKKAELERLAGQIQQEIANYDEDDPSAWIRIQDAMYQLRRATEPPNIFIMKQRFHVSVECLLPVQPENSYASIDN